MVSGERLGPYTIVEKLGEGGMGQVWRATDTTLGRQVAIKILPDAFASDSERLARFEREAKTLASLNHPNIAAIYGFEKSSGMHALVMELVEGDDLSQRIARGAIPLDEALPIARQIAEALEAAHEQGIIHRDLKPANIKVRADGVVKVLDFGLAKALDHPAASSPEAMNSPTITSPAHLRQGYGAAGTEAGMILGTAAYMSPEQARGKVVDKRADVWAFGAVLFEMLTGTRAFRGENVTDTIVSVISKEPDWTALPVNTPAVIRKLLRRCLEKDRKRRLDSMVAVRLEIQDALAPHTLAGVVPSTPSNGRSGWLVAAVATLAAVALAPNAVRHLLEAPAPPALETRLEVVTSGGGETTSFALSPDGRQIAFAASGDAGPQLWLRSLSTTTARPLLGTEGARFPFWAPDGRALGFFAGAALKRVDLTGAGPVTLAPAPLGRGGSWGVDGTILYSPDVTSPLMGVPSTGGDPTAVTKLAPGQFGHRWPQMLPDGRRFLFYVTGETAAAGIYLGSLDARPPVRLTPADVAGTYLAPGWLLWMRAGRLMAQSLDLAAVALTGAPVALAEGLTAGAAFNRGAVSASTTGVVAYRSGGERQGQLTWFDESGASHGTIGERDSDFGGPRVSPDGKRLAVSRRLAGNQDVWVVDGGRTSRFTFAAADDSYQLWSPDGTRIVYRSNREGPGDIYEKMASGAGAEERVVASDQLKNPTSWSRDGRYLLYYSIDRQSNSDLWVVPMDGKRTPAVFLQTPFREAYATFSPDGRWVAYQSDESGRSEVYVRPFVPPGAPLPTAPAGQWQVSTDGGIHPAWRPDGKALYYLGPAGAMMTAPIRVTRATLEPGAPTTLFATRVLGGGVEAQQGWQYDVAADGRLLINAVPDDVTAPITLLMNWIPESRK